MNAWRYKLKNAGNGFLIVDDDVNICDVYMTNHRPVAEGRARLIAAAPELLESARELYALLFAKLETLNDTDRRYLQKVQTLFRRLEGAR